MATDHSRFMRTRKKCQSFLAPDSVFRPIRVLRGTTKAVTHLQSSLSAAVPPELALCSCSAWKTCISLPNRRRVPEPRLCTLQALYTPPPSLASSEVPPLLHQDRLVWSSDRQTWQAIWPLRHRCSLKNSPANDRRPFPAVFMYHELAPHYYTQLLRSHRVPSRFFGKVYAIPQKRTRRSVSKIYPLPPQRFGWSPSEQHVFAHCR